MTRPETEIAIIPCRQCPDDGHPSGVAWKRHRFVRREAKDINGRYMHSDLIFACEAGHERAWGSAP
jgi:hypothetical protein